MVARKSGDEVLSPPPDRGQLLVKLAPMRRKHLRAVMRIETQVYPRPWTTSLFLSEMALRGKRAYTVAQVGSLVVGYSGLMFVGEDAHVTNIAVDPLWHGHKIATRLLLHDVRLALNNGARNLTLEVRVSNKAAQGLYRKFGFAPAGVRKNYYVEDKEDALVMWVNDIDSDDYALRLSAIEASVPGATLAEVPK
jgi:[ribosomal protein S18]-alanine N-acetyltransferase